MQQLCFVNCGLPKNECTCYNDLIIAAKELLAATQPDSSYNDLKLARLDVIKALKSIGDPY